MTTVTVEVPEDLLALLEQSRLGARPLADQVKIALAIHLFQEGLISVGKAAALAGEPRAGFEMLLAELGIATVYYDESAYDQDLAGIAAAKRRGHMP